MTNPDALPVELWDIDRLIPDPKNPKKHPQDQIEKLARSIIAAKGIANPLNIEPSGKIITGHGRRLAALHLKMKRIPVIVRHDLSPEEAQALRISDNATVSNEYDTELLKANVQELADIGFDLDGLGFDAHELEKLTSDFGDIADDAFVEDITQAVEDQKTENAAKEREVDSAAAPVSDALGFKRLTIEQSRVVRSFMTTIESKTGKQGAEALVAYIQGHAA